MTVKNQNNSFKKNLQELLNLISEPIIVLNKEGILLAANETLGKFIGVPTKELLGKNFQSVNIFNKENQKVIESRLERRLNDENIDDYELTVSIKGKTKYVEPKGNKIEYFGEAADLVIIHDVTKSKQRQTQITNSIRDAIILVDEEAKVTYWNPAAEKIFGYLSSEAIGKSVHALIVPDKLREEGKKRIEYSVKTFGETGTGYFTFGNVELKALRKDGSEFPVELSLSPIKLDGKWSAVGVIKDITERKEAEEKTRQAEERYHAFFNQAPLGVLVVDPRTGEFIEYNDAAHSQLGYTREEFSTISVFDIEAKVSPEETRTHLLELAKTGSGEYETRHCTKSGEIRNVIVTTKTIEILGRSLVHCFFHDITEIKRIQTELGKYSQKLEDLVEHRTELLKQTQAKLVKSERLAAIGELAGMIGHDLRNPLTGIKNSAYFLKKKGNTIPETQTKEMLETIDKCVDYSNKIVNDLLDYSREIHLEMQEYSPRKLLEESLAMVNVPDTIEIVNQIDEKPQLMVDLTKIKRVLINLIKNAIEAMPNVGKLTLYGKKLNDLFEISVADTGPGISDEVLPKLFTPLFTTKAQGMGFGLAICKRIVEAHGGTITVKTATGEGTTFKITLPIEPKNEIGGEKVWINVPESSLSTMTKR